MLIAVDVFALGIGAGAVLCATVLWLARHWLAPRLDTGGLDTVWVLRFVALGMLGIGVYSLVWGAAAS